MIWVLVRRGCRHLFRLRWEMRNGYQIECPCCGGQQLHDLLNPTKRLTYFTANVVDCAICQATGYVWESENYSYAGMRRGTCVTRR